MHVLGNCDTAFELNQDFITPEANFSLLLSFFFKLLGEKLLYTSQC